MKPVFDMGNHIQHRIGTGKGQRPLVGIVIFVSGRGYFRGLLDDLELSRIEGQFGGLPNGCPEVFLDLEHGIDHLRLRQQVGADPDAVMEGSQRAMRVALSREEEKLDTHLAFLATVGSISPYVGLFGTVWGIMNSFRGLANVQQATLATVAPGISEALIATAMGLFAAIPAVIAYNRFSQRADSMMTRYETFSDEFSSILHRQAHAHSVNRLGQ